MANGGAGFVVGSIAGSSRAADGSGSSLASRRANVSASLTSLRELGFAVTRPHEHDGRSIRVYPTAHAVETLTQLRTAWGALLAGAWAEDADGAGLAAVEERLAGVLARLTERPA